MYSRWWFQISLVSPLFGEDSNVDKFVSHALYPPYTVYVCIYIYMYDSFSIYIDLCIHVGKSKIVLPAMSMIIG